MNATEISLTAASNDLGGYLVMLNFTHILPSEARSRTESCLGRQMSEISFTALCESLASEGSVYYFCVTQRQDRTSARKIVQFPFLLVFEFDSYTLG